ncbi:MAG: PKD domain-containing protein, partial [Pirellulaceae bacterium]|nr:PKD domain-containing protein [Pirellulaceae bacterium]
PAHGALTLNGDGSFTYTPAANYFGQDSFLYSVTDGSSQSAPATVSLAIQSVNDVPSVSLLSDVVIPEGTALALAGSFSDADGPADAWTATVDYGDGTGVQPLAPIGTTFALDHAYADSGEYWITVTVVDRDLAIDSATFQVAVQNLPPIVNTGADQATSEGTLVNLTATFQDPGVIDTHVAVIDWGDGTVPAEVSVSETAGTGTLSASHVYSDNGVYVVSVTVTDNQGAAGLDSLSLAVENRPPAVDAGTDQVTTEGRTVRVVAPFTDPGWADSHSASVDWGDGTPTEAARISETTGAGTATASHIFVDEGVYTVTVTVMDDDGASHADSLIVTVNNVVPQIEVGADRTVQEGDVVEFPSPFTIEVVDAAFGRLTFTRVSGSFQDPGALDTHTAVIDWGDGTLEPAVVESAVSGGSKVGAVTGSHIYARSGQFVARVIVTDNDGGSNSDSLLVSVTSEPPPNDTTLSIAAASADQAEGNHGLTPFTFTVSRGGDTSGTTTVDFTVTGGGANPADASDFGGLLPGGQVTFSAGETSHTITVHVLGDATLEPHETFNVVLVNATGGATITSASVTGTIRNDDVVAGFSLDCAPLHVGLNTCTVLGATPQGVVDLALGVRPGTRYLSQFGVTLGMLDPTIVAQGIVQPDGRAVVQVHISSVELLERLLFQAFEQVPTPRTTNIVIVGTPLLAEDGRGAGAPALTPGEFSATLSALRSEAIARWTSTGLSRGESALLRAASVEVVDLADALLGQTIDKRIFLDVTAAGHGWFVDATPRDDAEFGLSVSATEHLAPAGTAAAGRIGRCARRPRIHTDGGNATHRHAATARIESPGRESRQSPIARRCPAGHQSPEQQRLSPCRGYCRRRVAFGCERRWVYITARCADDH